MTNTHRKSTTRTTAKIAAVGAFALGAAIALPGFAAAQDTTEPTGSLEAGSLESLPLDAASLEELPLDAASLEGALGTDLSIDLGSLNVSLVVDAETPNPGSVELGSLGITPNTGSAVIDGDGGSVTGSASDSVSDSVSGQISDSVEGIVPGSSIEDSALETATGLIEGSVSGEDSPLGDMSSEGPASVTGSLG